MKAVADMELPARTGHPRPALGVSIGVAGVGPVREAGQHPPRVRLGRCGEAAVQAIDDGLKRRRDVALRQVLSGSGQELEQRAIAVMLSSTLSM